MEARGTSSRETRGNRARAALGALIIVLVAACSTGPNLGLTGSIPRCNTVPQITARPELYRSAPIYVSNEMPTDQVLAWASGKPGFEEIWIDRDHLGWITVAFSRDADARQAELAHDLPGVGVVAVGVPWTKAELEALQAKVMTEGMPLVGGSGILVNHGVVEIYVPVLKPDVVAQIDAKFGGLRVCIDGLDPADAPKEGSQRASGEGWRLVADQDGIGGPYRTGIAADEASLAAMWSAIRLAGSAPDIDFDTEVVIWFGAVHGSSCPRLRLDDVVVDQGRSIVYPVITYLDVGACTADAIGHAYVVAFERSGLPHGPFTIQLQAEEPPPGAIEEKTIVDADLSAPGSTLTPDQLHSAPPVDDDPRVESGDIMEPNIPWRYRFSVACGIGWLGEFNDVWWRTDVPAGANLFVPEEWQSLVEGDGAIEVEVLLLLEPSPAITVTAGSHSVTYHPSPEEAPACR